MGAEPIHSYRARWSLGTPGSTLVVRNLVFGSQGPETHARGSGFRTEELEVKLCNLGVIVLSPTTKDRESGAAMETELTNRWNLLSQSDECFDGERGEKRRLVLVRPRCKEETGRAVDLTV
ncbi:hypothetical protein U1Q18_020696 [Sarracenia purpurea var. burkii]